MEDIKIEEAFINEAEILLILQKEAYKSEAEITGDIRIPPMAESIDDILKDFHDYTILKAVHNDKIIGSVRAKINEGNICYIGRLMVHPDFQNRGLGKRLMKKIENIFSECNKYELFTGEKSTKNISLYQKLGYTVKYSEKMNDKVNLVYMEKKRRIVNE